MKFIFRGLPFEVETLDPAIDQAFVDLHGAFLSDSVYQWDKFGVTAQQFFDRANFSQQDKFFSNFTIIWNQLLAAGQLSRAEDLWGMVLSLALEWEKQHQGRRIHKGTPFYFWGMTSILRGDLDRGYALMHRAVAEDVLSNPTGFTDSPAYALVILNSQKVDQAFRAWVLQKADFVEKRLGNFRQTHQRTLTLNDFQRRFLLVPSNREAVFLLAYIVARLLKLGQVPSYVLKSDFISQLYLNLLFDTTLVIDAAVKQHNLQQNKFIEHAAFLSQKASLGISQGQLRTINGEFVHDYDGTLRNLLGGSYQLPGNTVRTGLARDLAVIYGIRNRGAHDLSTVSSVRDKFTEILQSTFNVLFLTVETLY